MPSSNVGDSCQRLSIAGKAQKKTFFLPFAVAAQERDRMLESTCRMSPLQERQQSEDRCDPVLHLQLVCCVDGSLSVLQKVQDTEPRVCVFAHAW